MQYLDKVIAIFYMFIFYNLKQFLVYIMLINAP